MGGRLSDRNLNIIRKSQIREMRLRSLSHGIVDKEIYSVNENYWGVCPVCVLGRNPIVLINRIGNLSYAMDEHLVEGSWCLGQGKPPEAIYYKPGKERRC